MRPASWSAARVRGAEGAAPPKHPAPDARLVEEDRLKRIGPGQTPTQTRIRPLAPGRRSPAKGALDRARIESTDANPGLTPWAKSLPPTGSGLWPAED